MRLPFEIVVYESLNCPQCKRMDLKSYCWKGFKYAKDAGKPEKVKDLEDFSEEKRPFKLFRTKDSGTTIPNQT